MFLVSACVSVPRQNIILGSNVFEVQLTRYQHEHATKSLIIVPPTGGTNLIDKNYAKKFFDVGYDVYIVNNWPREVGQPFDLELHERFYSHAERAIEMTLQQIRTPFVGILGTSVGALQASIAVTHLDRINAAFLIVGGTPIAEVVVTSDQLAMQNLKKKRQKELGFRNDSEIISAITKVFNLEPTKSLLNLENKNFAMSIATHDETVPTKTQYQLRDFLKPQKMIVIDGDHLKGVVDTWLYHSNEIFEFFEASSKVKRAGATSLSKMLD
jgi:surfactin synthase thioesterase subunit